MEVNDTLRFDCLVVSPLLKLGALGMPLALPSSNWRRIQQFLTRYFSVLGNGSINHPDTYLKNRFSNSDTNNSDHVHVMLLPDQWSQ
jgi:hypothetical protein